MITMQPELRIGLTGGIGSGKSTVCNLFANIGVPVIDADEIAHELAGPGQPALRLITEAFGANVLTGTGELNRTYLRNLVFNDDAARARLENILHPLVYKEIEMKTKLLDCPYCIISIPLLIEKNAQDKVDRVLVIDATEEQQIFRACKRDHTEINNIKSVIQAQTTRARRLVAADDIIHNDGDMASLQRQVIKLHASYNNMATDKRVLNTPVS